MRVQLFLVFVFLLSMNFINPAFGAGVTKKIEPELNRKIDSAPAGSTWNIIILFKEDPKLLTPPTPKPSPEESHIPAYNTMLKLKKFAEESQSQVISEMKSFIAARSSSSASTNLQIKTRWCTNSVNISSASRDLIYYLGDAKKPELQNITLIVEDVAIQIGRGDKILETVSFPEESQSTGNELLDKAWGLKQIGAKAWWDAGFNGSGVIIGHIDDGVDINHPSIRYNWVGKVDGWYAPADNTSVFPYEGTPGSHGTHTLGTVIGRGNRKPGTNGTGNESHVNFYGVGVAPGARWISCGNCDPKILDQNNNSRCFAKHMVECLEFLYCPNDENRCLYRPNVISVSIGCDQNGTHACPYQGIFDPCIHRLRNHMVIPVFSAGNDGDMGCQTIGDPGDNEDVITVGNVDEHDELAADSGLGPPEWRYNETEIDAHGIFKPDIVAPGENIISTIYSGPDMKFSYALMGGTSMAVPHVAGAIALLLSRTEGLSFEDVKVILRNSSVNNTQLRSTNPRLECGKKADTALSNHKFGFGRLLMPDLNSDLMKVRFPPKEPTRKMPPPPDFTADAPPPPVPPGIVGVVMMISIAFLVTKF